MATITAEQLHGLVDLLRESKEELVPLKEEAANVSQLLGDAAAAIERSVKQENLEAAEEMISGLWQSLEDSPLILTVLPESEEDSHPAVATRGFEPTRAYKPTAVGMPDSLQRTAEMVFFLQELIRRIPRSL